MAAVAGAVLATCLLSALPAAARPSSGSVFAWSAQRGGLWTDPANWQLVAGARGAGFPNGASDTAEFPTAGAAAQVVMIPGGAQVMVGSIELSSSRPYTVAAGGPTARLVIAGPAQVNVRSAAVEDVIDTPVTLIAPLSASVGDTATLTFAAQIAGNGTARVRKEGDGVLRLESANTFTGGVAVNAGTLAVADDNALGAAPGVLSLDADAAVLGENGPHSFAVPVVLGGDNGKAIRFAGSDLTFSNMSSAVAKPTKLDVENHTSFGRLLDGQGGNRMLRVTGNGTLTLGAAGPDNVGYATGSIQALGTAGLEIGGTGAIGALGWSDATHGVLSVGGEGATGQLTAVGGVRLSRASTFAVQLDGPAPGTAYDQLVTTGTGGGPGGDVNLGNATLHATLGEGTAIGDTFTVIAAGGSVQGHFAGLIASGCTQDTGSGSLRIDYRPSAVILTRTATPNGQALDVGGFPSPIAAGASGSFTVRATDCDGHPLNDYEGTVAFTSSDPAATLPTPYTFTQQDGGAHTFIASFRTPGSQTLNVSAIAGAPDVAASQMGIVVVPPAPAGSTGTGLTGGGSPGTGPAGSGPGSSGPTGSRSSGSGSAGSGSSGSGSAGSGSSGSGAPGHGGAGAGQPGAGSPGSGGEPAPEPAMPAPTVPAPTAPAPHGTGPGVTATQAGRPAAPSAWPAEKAGGTAAPAIAVHRVRRAPGSGRTGDRRRPAARTTQAAARARTVAAGADVTGPSGRRTASNAFAGGRRRHSRHPGVLSRLLRKLLPAGLKTAVRFAFPLLLALLVVAFLVIQDRIDRDDPKLRLAPVDSKHDLVGFV